MGRCLLSIEFDNKYNNNDITTYLPGFLGKWYE